jgi:hypothetical protein
LLPDGADVEWFRGELERIKAGDLAGLRRQRERELEQVRACEEALAKLPPQLVDRNGLIAHRTTCQTRANFITRHQPKWRTWRYIELLALGKRAGVALGYTSEPEPHGDGVTYLIAAAAIVGAPLRPGRAGWLLRVYGKMLPTGAGMHAASTLSANAVIIKARPE